MSDLCKFTFDGLGTKCERCGCWRRGKNPPPCPPFITRMEPDSARLPNIKTAHDNGIAHSSYIAGLEAGVSRN